MEHYATFSFSVRSLHLKQAQTLVDQFKDVAEKSGNFSISIQETSIRDISSEDGIVEAYVYDCLIDTSQSGIDAEKVIENLKSWWNSGRIELPHKKLRDHSPEKHETKKTEMRKHRDNIVLYDYIENPHHMFYGHSMKQPEGDDSG